MGNTECGVLINSSSAQYQFIETQNHPSYGEIHHLKKQKSQQHVAVKKFNFQCQKQYVDFKQYIEQMIEISQVLPLVKILKAQGIKQKSPQSQQNKYSHQNKGKIQCNTSLLFSSPSQQFTCLSTSTYPYSIHFQYFSSSTSLASIIQEKCFNLSSLLDNNKVNTNIYLSLQKIKLNDYKKIDELPPKQRTVINLFYTEIQVLRMIDCMLGAGYGLKMLSKGSNNNRKQQDNKIYLKFNTQDIALRPELMFKNQEGKIVYLMNQVTKVKGNIKLTLQRMEEWLKNHQNNKNFNEKNQHKSFVSYIYPQVLPQIARVVSKVKQNEFGQKNIYQKEEIIQISQQLAQKSFIFALGLITMQLCLLQPQICSKIYLITSTSSKPNNIQTKKTHIKSVEKSVSRRSNLNNVKEPLKLTIKLNENQVKKYLSEIKNKYSEDLAELIEKMIFNSKDLKGYQSFESVIETLTQLIQKNMQRLKNVYDPTNISRSKSSQKSQKSQKINNVASLPRQLSSSSSITTPSLASTSSYSLLPVQSHQPVISWELLKKYYEKFQNKSETIIRKNQIALLSENMRNNENKLEQLITKDQERILNELNKIHSNKKLPNYYTNQRFKYRKIDSKGEDQNNKYSWSKDTHLHVFSQENNSILTTLNHSRNKQKRLNSTTKTKKQQIQKARLQEMMGNSICHTIPLKTKNQNRYDESALPKKVSNFQNLENKYTQPEIIPFSSTKEQLKKMIISKSQNNRINSEQKQLKHKLKQVKSQDIYQSYMEQYENMIAKSNLNLI